MTRVWRLSWRDDEIVHQCPPVGGYYTPCCGKTPFELPRDDRISLDRTAVTCLGGN